MRTLILMRHAKSSWGAPELADHDRPLNGRGRTSARAMGRWLKRHGYLPDAVLCSSALRTRDTFERLQIDAPVRFTPHLYHANPAELLQVLRGAEAPCVLMLGHNPGIAGFARSLLRSPPAHPRFDDYPTCATLVATLDLSTWAEIDWQTANVTDFAIPREVIAEES